MSNIKMTIWGAILNAFYQLGSSSTWPAMDVAAYDIGLEVFYKVTDPIKVSAGFEMLSGNDMVNPNNQQNAFNPYFGTNHKFNGVMDYFYVGNHIGNVGLNDYYLRADYKHKKFSAGVAGHIFMTNAAMADGNGGQANANLGTEIDAFGAFKIVPGATCKLGYSHMLGTDSMVTLKGGDLNEISNWGYVMVIIKPVLFKK